MKPEIATPNIIYKSKSPISTNKTEKALYKSLKGKKFQSPIGTNKTFCSTNLLRFLLVCFNPL